MWIVVIPFFVTLFEFIALIYECISFSKISRLKKSMNNPADITREKEKTSVVVFIVETALYLLCFFLEILYMELFDVITDADWTVQLVNNQRHQPIASNCIPTVAAIAVIYLIGMAVLSFTKTSKTPPLVTALAIGALYLGVIYSIIWTFHFVSDEVDLLFFSMLPVNSIFIAARLIVRKTGEYVPDPNRSTKIEQNPVLAFYNNFCMKASFFPVFGLLMVIPILGVMIVALLLFGQSPDAAIRAFTDTSDFRLSTKVSPENLTLYVDEHYLCTVAASGDKKIVKPLRKGLRHGHEVTVNRQLEIANAFEEVIQVHTPVFHRHLRHFYDTYGFPIAKLIKKNWVADMVYFIMKPLEYLFVIVLYLVEVHPEDRIALQYSGTTLERFKKENANIKL